MDLLVSHTRGVWLCLAAVLPQRMSIFFGGGVIFWSCFYASVQKFMHVEVRHAVDVSSVGIFWYETAAQTIPSNVLELWIMTWEKPNKKQLSWKQEMAADDIRSTEWYERLEKKKRTHQPTAEKWNSFVAHCMKGINILRVVIILPRSCWLELRRKPGVCCDRIHFIIQFPLGLFLSVNIFFRPCRKEMRKHTLTGN